MKKNLLILFNLLLVFSIGFSQNNPKHKTNVKFTKKVITIKKVSNAQKVKIDPKVAALRKSHQEFLKNNPLNKILNMSKSERKCEGLPPNKYFENDWLLTMDPATGMPDIYKLKSIRDNLIETRKQNTTSGRIPGDALDNLWVERGPNNVGGRVRAVMFDPNDPTKETVYAGSVSGGLWKNTAISNANSSWTRVNIAQNLNVSCITYDPNNTQIFYIGTGESYTGDAPGDGVWKSTDGGTSWAKVFGGVSGPTIAETTTNLIINSPAGIAGNYSGVPTTAFGPALTTNITQNIVLVDDGSATPTLGVDPFVNAAAINGKIALIRRGSPPASPGVGTFVLKITNAVNAGAVAVIIMNNVTGGPQPIGGTDPSGAITIPSLAVSKADGDILEAAVISGTVNGTLKPSGSGEFTGNLVPGPQYINEIKIRNNAGVSEIYVAVGDAAEAGASLGGRSFGLYKSVNGGASWNQLTLPALPNGNKYCPMDIEIAPSDNKIYVSTTNSATFGEGGGAILSSTDGVNFNVAFQVTGAKRTQIAVSNTDSNKVYVLLNSAANEADLYLTTNGFGTLNQLTNEPLGSGTIPATDFTRGQAFYDLMLEVDPTNDAIVYTGGINLYRSSDSGSTWTEISNWNGITSTSIVHSDQHGMAFKPGVPNSAIFGNDGGIYYTSNLSGTVTPVNNLIEERLNGLNITQFYSVGVAPTGATGGNLVNDYFAAGAQDNGTQYFGGVITGTVPSIRSQSGDGAFTLFDQGTDKYYISNYIYNDNVNVRTINGDLRPLSDSTTGKGAFIAPMALDSNRDMLYSDYTDPATTPATFQIRRYSNIKFGTATAVVRTNLTNALLTSSPTALTVTRAIPSLAAPTTLLVGTRNGKLLKLVNPNATPTWSDLTGSSFVGSVSDVEYGQTINDIFVTFSNYNVASIWYSANGGSTWQNKEGNFPDIPVRTILQNPLNLNEVLIGTELGVWYTNDFSSSSPIWRQSYNGMSNVKVTDLDLRNDNTVFAATYGRGVFSGLLTSAPLSTVDFTSSKEINIYPNPSNGIVNITINDYTGKANLQVIDVNGREVYSLKNTDFNVEKSIDLSGLQSGVYIVKINAQGANYTKKIVIN
jgi:Secretion system C-terminal sorting domain/PA domain